MKKRRILSPPSLESSSLREEPHQIRKAIYTIRVKNRPPSQWPNIETAVRFVNYSAGVSKRLFGDVVLHTDSSGKKLFGGGSFQQIVTDLDDFPAPSTLRNACKLQTFSKQKVPFIHFDWDFILWENQKLLSKEPIISLNQFPSRLAPQLSLIWRSIAWKPNFLTHIVERETYPQLPSTALLAVNEPAFLSEYAALGLKILNHPKNTFLKTLANTDLARDIDSAFGPWLLGAYAEHCGVDLAFLAKNDVTPDEAIDEAQIPKSGYTHLSGINKSSKYWQKRTSFGGFARETLKSPTEAIEIKKIPYSVLISLEKHSARRKKAFQQFSELGLKVEWKTPVKLTDIRWDPTTDMYESKPSSASHALTLLEILNKVEKLKIDQFAIYEDDVIFNPSIISLVSDIQIPKDWMFIYLGGRNCGIKTPISRGLVRSTFAVDLHAVIIRSKVIPDIRRVLMDPCINSVYLDFRIATLHKQYPAYLCRPNLAWQSSHSGDMSLGPVYSNYHEDGTVKFGQGD